MPRLLPRPVRPFALAALAVVAAVTAGATLLGAVQDDATAVRAGDDEATLRAAAAAGPVEVELPGASTTAAPAPSTPPAPATTEAAAPPAPPDPAAIPPPPVAPRRGGIPFGTGMWIWQPERVEGGNPRAIVERAVATGVTHVYVRTGSSRQGLQNLAFLDALLPLAHHAGLRVYGWDFPYLDDLAADVERAVAAVRHRSPSGHRIDGFVPDIETRAEGTHLSSASAGAYSALLRAAVGPDYPLIACVPHPTSYQQKRFPYGAVLPHFDAVAPMVYWLNRQPDSDAALAVAYLSRFGKPVIPIGQAYDGGPEGGRPGPPPPDEIHRFLTAAERAGATGASFWSWQHATGEIWGAIADAPEFAVPADVPLRAVQVRAVQVQLRSQGYWVEPSGTWDAATVHAVAAFQADAGLLPTGHFDAATRAALLAPHAPPL